MTSTQSAAVDTAMAQLEAIANRLQRGEISMAEADEESKQVHAALEQQTLTEIKASLAARQASRKRRSFIFLVALVLLVLAAVYFRQSGAA